MPSVPVIYIVCSLRPRAGKTLLARALVDYLLLDGHDPFVIDASDASFTLRSYFPGRTAAVDFGQTIGRMKLFDTIMGGPGRDYVVDLAPSAMRYFFRFASELNFMGEAHKAGFQTVAICFAAGGEGQAAATVAEGGVRHFVAAYEDEPVSLDEACTIELPPLDPTVAVAIAHRRISLRAFLMGEEQAVPEAARTPLKSFLYGLITAFRAMESQLGLKSIRGGLWAA